jgi:hypothetical protein
VQADHYVISWMAAPLKLIYSSIEVCDVLVLPVCGKLINFVFQIFLPFIHETTAGIMSCIVLVIIIYSAWIL